MVTAVAAWSIWGSDMFPSEADPKGSKQEARQTFKYMLTGKIPRTGLSMR